MRGSKFCSGIVNIIIAAVNPDNFVSKIKLSYYSIFIELIVITYFVSVKSYESLRLKRAKI